MRRTRSLFVVVALLALGASNAAATDTESGTRSFTLENGLRVRIHRIEGMLGGFVEVLYTFGEESDPRGRSGLAELMRRLYLSCDPGVPVARDGDGGSRQDSHAGDDYTSFCHGVPMDRFRGELREAAARMSQLRIGAEDLERERGWLLRDIREAS